MSSLINGLSPFVVPIGVSELLTVVFDNVVFVAGSYTNNEGEVITYPKIRLDAVQLVVERTKVIVDSRVAGRDGTIKEYITNGDYEISLSAIIAPKLLGLERAEKQLQELALLETVPQSVRVRSKVLQEIYDVDSVVIRQINISKYQGDSYAVRVMMSSDKEVDLSDIG